jgi:hypothetical protein
MINKENGPTYLELCLDVFDSIIEGIKLAGQTAQKGKAQLLVCPPGTIAFHTHRRELVR